MKAIISFAIFVTLASTPGCRTKSVYPNCNSNDIELMDSCLLGNTLEEGIGKMNIDTTNFIPMLIFAREVHGIFIRLGDSCKITVIVEKPFVMNDEQMKVLESNGRFDIKGPWKSIYKYILHKKIVGICWRKNKARKVRVVGDMKYHDCWDY
jgi:hypothetical protein